MPISSKVPDTLKRLLLGGGFSGVILLDLVQCISSLPYIYEKALSSRSFTSSPPQIAFVSSRFTITIFPTIRTNLIENHILRPYIGNVRLRPSQ